MAISRQIPSYVSPIDPVTNKINPEWELYFRSSADNSIQLKANTTGLITQTSTTDTVNRAIEAASSKISVTNGDGVNGNPMIDVNQSNLTLAQSQVTNLVSDLAAKAPLASPTFTGTVTIPSPFTLGATFVTSTGAEINKLDGAPFDATFTIGAEAANVINVAVQLKDANGTNLATLSSLTAYLSDNSTGNNFIATAPSGTVVIGTNGALFDVGSAKKVFHLISNATGQIDINITESAAKTLYLVLILPNGLLKVSSAITFT